MGILEIFFSLLILSIPIGQIFRIDVGDIGILSSDVLAGLIFVYLVFKITRERNLSVPPLFKSGVIFLTLLSLSLLLNIGKLSTNEFLISLLYLLRLVFYMSIYMAFFYLNKDFIKNKINKIFIISGFTFLLLGYFQILLYPDLRNLFYAGWDEHLYRFFSSFLDPNFAGAFLVIFFIFILDKFYQGFFGEIKVFAVMLLALIFLAIFMTFSRSAYLLLLLGSTLFLFLENKKRELMIIIIAFVFLLVVFVNNNLFGEGTKLFRTASVIARTNSIQNALIVFKDNPIFGIGFNSYKYVQEEYGFIEKRDIKIRSAFGIDNSYVLVLVTGGIIGLIGYVYLILNIAKRAIKKPFLISFVLVILAGSLFNNLFFYPFIMIWFFAFLGLRDYKEP